MAKRTSGPVSHGQDKEQQMLTALEVERSALRRQRLLAFEQRHKMIRERVKRDVERNVKEPAAHR